MQSSDTAYIHANDKAVSSGGGCRNPASPKRLLRGSSTCVTRPSRIRNSYKTATMHHMFHSSMTGSGSHIYRLHRIFLTTKGPPSPSRSAKMPTCPIDLRLRQASWKIRRLQSWGWYYVDRVAWGLATSGENCHNAISSLLPAYRCLLYTSPSPRDRTRSRMPSSA